MLRMVSHILRFYVYSGIDDIREQAPEPTTTENRLRNRRLVSEMKELVQKKTVSTEKEKVLILASPIFEDS